MKITVEIPEDFDQLLQQMKAGEDYPCDRATVTVTPPITEETNAMFCFMWHIGIGAFRGCTTIRVFNEDGRYFFSPGKCHHP